MVWNVVAFSVRSRLRLSVPFSKALSLNLPERETPREPSQICQGELPRANFLKAQQS
jgi:hypothetical protein